MCFGVKAAIHKAEQLAERERVTILGELAHNSTVKEGLQRRGATHGRLEDAKADTEQVVITAHGAADRCSDRSVRACRGEGFDRRFPAGANDFIGPRCGAVESSEYG